MSSPARRALCLAVGAIALIGCSGDDDTSTTTAAPSSSTVPSSTATSSTTPTTVPPATSTTTTPTSTSTTAPMTVEEEVTAAYQAAYDAFWAASQNPNDPELRRSLELVMTGMALERATEVLDGYVLANQRVTPNPEVEDEFTIQTLTVDGAIADLVGCMVNPWIVVEDGADGPVVVDDAVYVTRVSVAMRLDDGVWRQDDGQIIEDLSEVGECPAS